MDLYVAVVLTDVWQLCEHVAVRRVCLHRVVSRLGDGVILYQSALLQHLNDVCLTCLIRDIGTSYIKGWKDFV